MAEHGSPVRSADNRNVACDFRSHFVGEIEIGAGLGLGRLGTSEIGLGAGQRRLIVARIDLQQQVAGLDLLVVVDQEPQHLAADLRAQADRIPVDECVIGGDEAAIEPPIGRAADDRRPDRGDGDQSAQPALLLLLGRGRRFRWGRRANDPLVRLLGAGFRLRPGGCS